MANYKEKLSTITTFVFDYDGVMTNGNIFLTPSGEQLRMSSVKDGYALQYAIKKGYRIAIISGGTGNTMIERMNLLGITDVFTGVPNKLVKLKEYLEKHQIEPSQVLFMGDDIPDYELMCYAGVATCPADAVEEIKQKADYISSFAGGKGCVRDVIEQVMRLHDNWFHADAVHW